MRMTRRTALTLGLFAAGLPEVLAARRVAAQSGNIELAIEKPAPDAPVSGLVEIAGWAVDRTAAQGTGVGSVLIYAGGDASTGTLLGEARYGLNRPDIGDRYGAPRFAASGFSFVWDASARPAGPVPIVAYARTAAGDWGYANSTITLDRPRPVVAAGAFTVELVEVVSPAAPGSQASIAARTEPSAGCVLMLVGPFGPVGWPGLGPQSADASGIARWSYTVPAGAPPGAYSVAVLASLGQQLATARSQLTVG